MKKENTAIRLKTIMNMRGLRQVDILNLTVPYCQKYSVKMNKSDISQYCSGKTEPNQEKLFILGNALNVSEAWLMGFDVPMERTPYKAESVQNSSKASKKISMKYIFNFHLIIRIEYSHTPRIFSPPSRWKKIFLQLMPGRMLSKHPKVFSMIWIL